MAEYGMNVHHDSLIALENGSFLGDSDVPCSALVMRRATILCDKPLLILVLLVTTCMMKIYYRSHIKSLHQELFVPDDIKISRCRILHSSSSEDLNVAYI